MKTILCYGDSNTWGAMPMQANGLMPRHNYDNRWTTVLQRALGDDVQVVVDAVSGRTIASDSPTAGHVRNGLHHAPVTISANYPVDMIIVMLGTNDVQDMYGLTPEKIISHMLSLVECMRHAHGKNNPSNEPIGDPVDIVLVCPPPVNDMIFGSLKTPCEPTEKSKALSPLYKELSTFKSLGFVDAGDIISVSVKDGIHWDSEAQKTFGLYMANYVIDRWS